MSAQFRSVVIMLCVMVGQSGSLLAQSSWSWVSPGARKAVTLEFLNPDFKNESFSFPSSAIFLTGRFPFSRGSVMVELPVAMTDATFFDESRSETMFGNPYIGLEVSSSPRLAFELGLRVPVASDTKPLAAGVGAASDADRLEAFVSDLLPISVKLRYRSKNAENVVFGFRVGPTLWVFTDDVGGFRDEGEILMDYGAHVGYEAGTLSVVGGVSGRWNLTSGSGFSDSSFHQVAATVNLNLGQARPGVHLRIPLDEDLRDTYNFVLGLQLGLVLQ